MRTLHGYRSFITFVLLAFFGLSVDAAGREGSKEVAQSNSIYSGTLELNWLGDSPGCKAIFKADNTILQFGPARSSKEPYYIRLDTPSHSDLVFSVRGSPRGEEATGDMERPLSVKKQSLEELNYELSGNLQQADEPENARKNVLANVLSPDDLARCGVEHEDFSWTPSGDGWFVHILFMGWVDDKKATIQGQGMYPVPGRNLDVKYTFTFIGQWDPDSATLSMKENIPTWEAPSRTGDMPGMATVTAKGSIVTVTPSPKSPTVDLAPSFTGSSVLGIGSLATATPQSNPDSANSDSVEPSSSPSLSRGTVIGITIGSVTGAVILGGLIYIFVRRWHKRRNQVYPEVAWIYAPSPAPSSSSASDLLYQCAGPGSAGFSSPEPPRTYQDPYHNNRSVEQVEPYEMAMRGNRF